jgi:hypothetical protein
MVEIFFEGVYYNMHLTFLNGKVKESNASSCMISPGGAILLS